MRTTMGMIIQASRTHLVDIMHEVLAAVSQNTDKYAQNVETPTMLANISNKTYPPSETHG